MHEILCPKDESHLTIEFKNYYIIKPTIGLEIKNNYQLNPLKEKGKFVSKNFEYSSSENEFLNVKQIKKLLH